MPGNITIPLAALDKILHTTIAYGMDNQPTQLSLYRAQKEAASRGQTSVTLSADDFAAFINAAKPFGVNPTTIGEWEKYLTSPASLTEPPEKKGQTAEQWKNKFISEGQDPFKAGQLAEAMQKEGTVVNQLAQEKKTYPERPTYEYYGHFPGQTQKEAEESAKLLKEKVKQYQEEIKQGKPFQVFSAPEEEVPEPPPGSTEEYFKNLHQRVNAATADLRRQMRQGTFHHRGQRVAPSDSATEAAHAQLEAFLNDASRTQAFDTINENLKTLGSEPGVPSYILERIKELSTQSPTESKVYKDYMGNPLYKDMVRDYETQAKRHFEEDVLPKVQNQYIGRGLLPSSARQHAQRSAATQYFTRLDENMRKMLHDQHEAGVRAATDAQKFGLLASREEATTREQARNMALGINNAQSASLYNQGEDLLRRAQAAHNVGLSAQQQKQNILKEEMDRFQEHRDAPLALAQAESAIAHNVPQIPQLPHTSRAPVPTAAPSPFTVASAGLSSLMGLDQTKEKKAQGGEVGQEEYTPTQQQQLEISRQLSQPSGDPMKRLFALIGANQLANLRKDPLESMGTALISHQQNEAAREKDFNDRQIKRAELLDAIDKQKLKQRELVDQMIRHREDLAHKKEELGETREYHTRHLDILDKKSTQPKPLTQDQYNDARDQVQSNLNTLNLIKEARKELNKFETGEATTALLGDSPLLGGFLKNPVVRSGFSNEERGTRENFDTINRTLASSIAKGLFGKNTTASALQKVEQGLPSNMMTKQANLEGYKRLEKEALDRLEEAYRQGIVTPEEWVNLKQSITSEEGSNPDARSSPIANQSSKAAREARIAELEAKQRA